MKLSYINDLFVKNTGISCPDELEEILIRIYIMPFRNFRNINKLLNLSPSMGQIEDWEKKAIRMKKPELSKTLENMNEDVYDQRWFLPVDESVKGKSGILKSGLVCEYVNRQMFNHCYQSYTALKEDMVFGKIFYKDKRWKEFKITDYPKYYEIKEEKYRSLTKNIIDEYSSPMDVLVTWETEKLITYLLLNDPSSVVFKNTRNGEKNSILAIKTGNMRSYSRHPIISNTARRWIRSHGYNEESENKMAVGDMVTSFMVKDNYEYDHIQGKGIYYCFDGIGKVRKR